MSRIVFSLTEAQYQAIVYAHERRPAYGIPGTPRRLHSVSLDLVRRGFLVRDWSRGDATFLLAPAGAAIIALGQALDQHQMPAATVRPDQT